MYDRTRSVAASRVVALSRPCVIVSSDIGRGIGFAVAGGLESAAGREVTVPAASAEIDGEPSADKGGGLVSGLFAAPSADIGGGFVSGLFAGGSVLLPGFGTRPLCA